MGTTITKGKIGEQDLNRYDGVVNTFSRPTSTGGSTTLRKIGYSVDVLMSYGDGISFSLFTLNTAIKTIGTTQCEILLRPGTWTIDDNLTIPSNLYLSMPYGCILNISSGKTLTINGPFSSGLYQVFSGDGLVVFGTGPVSPYPEWWGTTGINKAITSISAIGGKVRLSAKSYTEDVVLTGQSIILEGSGASSNTSYIGTIVYGTLEIGTTSLSADRSVVRDIFFAGPGVTYPTTYTHHAGVGITIYKGVECLLDNVAVEGFKYGLDVYQDDAMILSILRDWSMTIQHCRFYNNSICNVAMGRGNHALTIRDSNMSWSGYNLVVGVFDYATDTIDFTYADPVVAMNVVNCTIQDGRNADIWITNTKNVGIIGNYFETLQTASTACIVLGSLATPKNVYNGFPARVLNPVITGNFFQINTYAKDYATGFSVIKPIYVKGGTISENYLVNVIPSGHSDAEQQTIRLVDNEDFSEVNVQNLLVQNNNTEGTQDVWKPYTVIEGSEGFSTYHGSWMFSFPTTEDTPKYLGAIDNYSYDVTGTKYHIGLLVGTLGTATAEFGVIADNPDVDVPFPPFPVTKTTPSDGTYKVGDKIVEQSRYINSSLTFESGWYCTAAGTLGTLSTTGGITTGTASLVVASASGMVAGQYITIAGVTGIKQILRVNGTTITLTSNADATVAGAAVAFSAATLKKFQTLWM